MNQPYVPKPVYPVGAERLSQQASMSTANCNHRQNLPSLPSHSTPHLPIPLASLIRAGVPVTQWGQTIPTAHLGTATASSSTTATPAANANESKSEVVMIDLDELPSPTKFAQEPVQAQGNQSNFTDLVRMARSAFPNLSPAFIGLLLNQGNAPKDARENVPDAQASATSPQASATVSVNVQDGDQKDESCERTSISNTDIESAAENSQTLRGLLAKSLAAQEKGEVSSSHSESIEQSVDMFPDECGNSPSPSIVQGGTTLDKPDNQAQQEKAEVSAEPTPPLVEDGKSSEQRESQDREKGPKSPSPTPPTVKQGRGSPAPQGMSSVDTTQGSGEHSTKEKETSAKEDGD